MQTRISALCLLLVISSLAFGENAPQAVPPGVGQPPSFNAAPASAGPHVETDIRLVTLDARGALDSASKKLIDDMSAQGWRTTGMSTVSANPVTIAVMFSKMQMPQRPALPPRQSQPLPVPAAPAAAPIPTSATPQAQPTSAPAGTSPAPAPGH